MWWIRSAKERCRSWGDAGCAKVLEDGEPTSVVAMLGVKLQLFSSRLSRAVEDKDVGRNSFLFRMSVHRD